MIQDLKNKGYISLDTNIQENELLDIVKVFRKFDISTSMEDKNSTWFNKDNNLRIRLGYKDKTDSIGFDSKCYFHYHPDILQQNSLSTNIEYQNFLEKIDALYKKLELHVINIFEDLSQNQLINKKDFIDVHGNCNLTLRILNYKPKEICQTLAKAHTDRNFITLTVYETDDGLRFYGKDNIENIEYKPNSLKVFPGDLWSAYSREHISGTIHDVIKKEGNLERSSIVLFCLPLE